MGSQAALTLVTEETGLARRDDDRHRALLCATLVTTTSECSIKVRDLSVSGALIEGERLPRAGTDILLKRGTLEVLATVMWLKDNRAGLKFDGSLSQGEVWAQINPRTAAAPAAPSIYRPGFRGDQVRAEERAIARAQRLAAARKFLRS